MSEFFLNRVFPWDPLDSMIEGADFVTEKGP